MIKKIKSLVAKLRVWVLRFKDSLIKYLTEKPTQVSLTFTLGLAIGVMDVSLGVFFLAAYALVMLYRKGLK